MKRLFWNILKVLAICGYIYLGVFAFNKFSPYRIETFLIRKLPSSYIPKLQWEEVCWGRALDILDEMRHDEDITHARMMIGTYLRKAHAWIEYTDKNGNEMRYDPMFDYKEKLQ